MSVAIIGGTGIYSAEGIAADAQQVDTPFGPVELYRGQGKYSDLYFITRHGADHSVPPHMVDYRANIEALSLLGVSHAVGIYAVGSITHRVPPGGIGLIDQFIDMTHGRQSTFDNGGVSGLKHTDMSEPYCPALRNNVLSAARARGIEMGSQGTYLCCNGPRFETAAEIQMYKQWGADFAGMTAATETTLARERDIHFAGMVYSINWAAGVKQDIEFITRDRVVENKRILLDLAVAALYAEKAACSCEHQPVF
ncbi:MAG: MTAP family purine nucleoside phosphorylase [Spirochaetota bacterium]